MKKKANRSGVSAYLITTFLNVLLDLGDKILLQNAVFKVYSGSTQIILMAFINSLILLPFIMFFTPSGFIGDRFNKTWILRYSSVVSLVLVAFVAVACYFAQFELLLFLMFVLAMQSTFMSPAKYGIIGDIFGRKNLSYGNSLVQISTITAILLASFVMSVFFENQVTGEEENINEILHSIWEIFLLLVVVAVVQLIFSFKIPVVKHIKDTNLKFKFKKYIRFGYVKENMKIALSSSGVVSSAILLAVFFAVFQVVVAIFGAHLKVVANEDNTIVLQGILAMAVLGMAVGAYVSYKYSKHYVEVGMLPVSIVGMMVSMFFISISANEIALAFLFIAFGFFGGVADVIVMSFIQEITKESKIGRVMAVNNLIQNIAMILALIFTMLGAVFLFSTTNIFISSSVLLAVTSIYAFYKFGYFCIRFALKVFITIINYKVRAYGLDNVPSKGGVLILSNHVSYIDWVIISIVSRRKICYVIDKSFYDVKFLTPIFKFAGLVPISTTSSKSSLQKVRQKLENNEVVCIFAEGVITRNGCLNKFQKGFEFILKDMDNIPVIPCYIRGLWGSKFSFAKSLQKKLFKQNGKNVSVIFGKKISHPNAVSAKQAIQELSYELQQRFFEDETLGKRLIGAIKKNGNKIIAKENNKKIKGYAFLATVSKIASNIKEHSDKAPIGIAMAPSINATIINFACWLAHKKVININISNLKDLKNTVSEHMIVKIYTAKNLIKDVEENIFDIENSSNIKVVSVEKEIEKHTKGFGFFVKCLAIKFSSVSRLQNILDKKSTQKDNPNNGLNDIAIVCNTNNSNLHQKQNLSHKDILSNIDQMISNMGLEIDSLVVSYKLFYEENYFILSVLLPILNGVKIDFYPNHKNTIGLCKFIAKNQTSLLITDDKFLKDCAQNLKSPALLSSLKSIFYSCCAYDKYNDDVDCKVFRQKFNLEIFSFQTAYAMVVSANSPSFLINSTGAEVQIGYKENSLGMVLLGSFCKVVNPQSQEELGVGEEGEIYIKSTVKNNNMNIDKYNNPFGIGYIDEDGFLFLRKNTNR